MTAPTPQGSTPYVEADADGRARSCQRVVSYNQCGQPATEVLRTFIGFLPPQAGGGSTLVACPLVTHSLGGVQEGGRSPFGCGCPVLPYPVPPSPLAPPQAPQPWAAAQAHYLPPPQQVGGGASSSSPWSPPGLLERLAEQDNKFSQLAESIAQLAGQVKGVKDQDDNCHRVKDGWKKGDGDWGPSDRPKQTDRGGQTQAQRWASRWQDQPNKNPHDRRQKSGWHNQGHGPGGSPVGTEGLPPPDRNQPDPAFEQDPWGAWQAWQQLERQCAQNLTTRQAGRNGPPFFNP